MGSRTLFKKLLHSASQKVSLAAGLGFNYGVKEA